MVNVITFDTGMCISIHSLGGASLGSEGAVALLEILESKTTLQKL